MIVELGIAVALSVVPAPASDDQLREQIKVERVEFKRDTRSLRAAITRARRSALDTAPRPVYPSPPRLATVRPGDLRGALRSQRVRHDYHLAKQRAVLKSVRTAIPDVPRWFVRTALQIGECETGDQDGILEAGEPDWDYNGSSGFDGAYQFHPGTWTRTKIVWHPKPLPSYAYQATPVQQTEAMYSWYKAIGGTFQGTQGWPDCSIRVGAP